jgi:Leucine-rich repeat (LRR) protein
LDENIFNFSIFLNLIRLDLSSNQIQMIKSEHLSKNLELDILNLSSNSIKIIEPSSLLDLSFYLLRNIDDLIKVPYEFTDRLYIFINNNLIEKLSHISHDLSRNLLKEIPQAIRSMGWTDLSVNSFDFRLRGLDYLDLSQNQIETIEKGSLRHLVNLRTLNLAINRISSLDNHMFASSLMIRNLNLCRNYLEFIQENLFKDLAKFESLDIGHNQIKFIENDAFSSLNLLEYLNIYSNTSDLLLTNQTFSGLKSIKQFILAENLLSNAENIRVMVMINYLPVYEYPNIKANNKY